MALTISLRAQNGARNYIDLNINNDDAGELSTRMKTGNDLGETYTSHLSYHDYTWSSKFNFALYAESTLYTALDLSTKKVYRDVLCNERNHFRFALNNLKSNSFFYTVAVGCDYIQSKKPGIGAGGQAKLYHEKIINPNFPTKYWIYNYKNTPTRLFPYIEARYGYAHKLVNNSRFLVQLLNEAGVLLSSNNNFSEVRSINQLSAAWLFGKSKSYSIQYDFEYYFSSNFLALQNTYFKNLVALKIRSFMFSFGLTVPISKNISNPYLPYNDKEILFHYNIRVYLGKVKQKEREEK